MTKIAKPVREHSGLFETEHKSEVSNKTQEKSNGDKCLNHSKCYHSDRKVQQYI